MKLSIRKILFFCLKYHLLRTIDLRSFFAYVCIVQHVLFLFSWRDSLRALPFRCGHTVVIYTVFLPNMNA